MNCFHIILARVIDVAAAATTAEIECGILDGK